MTIQRKISTLIAIVALPSQRIVSTHEIESLLEEKGAVKAASEELNEIPTSAYLIDSQSLAPSPIIPTLICYN